MDESESQADSDEFDSSEDENTSGFNRKVCLTNSPEAGKKKCCTYDKNGKEKKCKVSKM